MDVKKQKGIKEEMSEEAYMNESMYEEEIQMTEEEKAIDEMIAREELHGGQKKLDVDKDGEIEGSDLAALRAGKKVEEGEEMSDKIAGAKMNEGRMSIAKLLESIAEEEIAKSEVKKKV